MQWRSETALNWPPDHAWQRAWDLLTSEIEQLTVAADDTVQLPHSDTGTPPVVLTSGSHLAPGAGYRIAADRLSSGELSAAVEGWQRDVRLSWMRYEGAGRADLWLRGLADLVEVRMRSSLAELTGEVVVTPRPEALFHVDGRLPWLEVRCRIVRAAGGGDLLTGELEVKGVGLWQPILAPLLAAFRGRIEESLVSALTAVAETLDALGDDEFQPSVASPWRIGPAEARHRIRIGMEEVGRRMHGLHRSVSTLPWWQRGARRWRREHAALPPGTWPAEDLLAHSPWSSVDLEAAQRLAPRRRRRSAEEIDRVVADLGAARLAAFAQMDEIVKEAIAHTRSESRGVDPGRPWPSDQDLDLTWLATPWSTIRKLTGVASDAAAQQFVADAVAASPPASPAG